MRAYGRKNGDEMEYRDLGAPSRHRKTHSKVRVSGRRIMHKAARRAAKVVIAEALEEVECTE